MSATGDNEDNLRNFDFARDLAAVKRIWREVGWVDDEHSEKQLDHFFAGGSAMVGTINDVPECSVHITPGAMRLQVTDLPLCAVTAVTTSRIARGQAFAQRLTARQLARGQAAGAAVAALGMFDQGFYDKLGFGTGAYENEFTFDPDLLMVSGRVRPPQRLSTDDAGAVHDAMLRRQRGNGGVVLHSPEVTRGDLGFDEDAFGLGYRDDGGNVTHFLWLKPEGERGPYRVVQPAYGTTEQLLELLGVLKSLADQVYSVKMLEPREVQLQALLRRPMRHMTLTRGSKHDNHIRTLAWWQVRTLDVGACVGALSCDVPVQFNLTLTDPLAAHLPADAPWRGVGGDYTISLGAESVARAGHVPDKPVLSASVNSFSRLLWGVAPATSLAITDDMEADAELLDALDRALHLPAPATGMEF